MSTLDQIIEAARTLPLEDLRSLMQWLQEQERMAIADQQPEDPVREQTDRFRKAMKWIDDHREQYLGQWVALQGDRLVSHGANAKSVHEQAKAAGIEIPFVVRVERKEESLFRRLVVTMAHNLRFSLAHSYDTRLTDIQVPVIIRSGSQATELYAGVDTGATFCTGLPTPKIA